MQPPSLELLLNLLAELPSAKTPFTRCLPLGRRRSPLWRACRFSSCGRTAWTSGGFQTITYHLKESFWMLFSHHSLSDVSIWRKKNNVASCRLLHGWFAAQLGSCDAAWTSGELETLGDQHSVCPSSCHVKDMSAFMLFERFCKKKKSMYFACCLISCSCFSWNAFGPYVCTLSLPLTGGLLSYRGQISTRRML